MDKEQRRDHVRSINKRSGPGKELTGKRLIFVDEYMIHRDAKKAAATAGYQAVPSDLVNNPGPIRTEIQRRLGIISEKYNVTAERIIGELAKIAFSNIDDVMDIAINGTPVINFRKSGKEERGAISEISQEIYTDPNTALYDDEADTDNEGRKVKRIKIKFWDKLSALNQLAKIQGLLTDQGPDAKDVQTLAEKLRQFAQATQSTDGVNNVKTPTASPTVQGS